QPHTWLYATSLLICTLTGRSAHLHTSVPPLKPSLPYFTPLSTAGWIEIAIFVTSPCHLAGRYPPRCPLRAVFDDARRRDTAQGKNGRSRERGRRSGAAHSSPTFEPACGAARRRPRASARIARSSSAIAPSGRSSGSASAPRSDQH